MRKTIPEQLSDALAQIEAFKAASADSGALIALRNERDALASSIETLRTENADLRAKLSTAESGHQASIKKALEDARAAMEKDFEMRVSDRAVEIMASVGQSAPSSFMPEGKQSKSSGKPGDGTHRLAVEEMYREKYNIS